MKRLLLSCLLALAACTSPRPNAPVQAGDSKASAVDAAAPAASASPASASPASATPAQAEAAPAPKVLSLPRPKGGEWMGLYVLGKKAGWAFSDMREGELDGRKVVVSISRVVIKASVGGAAMERDVRDERFYDYKDGGSLLVLRQEKHGDGGDEVLIARNLGEAVELKRVRPGLPDEVRKLPATTEKVEDADPARFVIATREKRLGANFDLERLLADKKVDTEFDGELTVTAAGVSVPAARTKTIEEESRLPIVSVVAKDGRQLELQFGEVMVGKAESEQVAKQLDKVDIFNLTRVVLDKPLPEGMRVPGSSIVWRVAGLTRDMPLPGGRQVVSDGKDGTPLLTISTRLPKERAQRPIAPGADKDLLDALKPNLAVESDAPAIVAKAKEVVGEEKDAWAAARKVNAFVNGFLDKAYGSSSDRATDVLSTRRGDCTEHALLMASLLRAVGIPAKRIDGLVYMKASDGVPALYWHEWVEVYVGEWVQMDPTFNQVVADPSHIALGSEAKADTAGLIGKLKFEPVEIKPGKPSPVPAAK
ncbi:MAG TPA: transglutaminase-like domain-containing protein [Myxococcales bacterium]|jgi:predicted transglutaminase-like cysteine proteinase